jgi:hypothetical protein
MKHTVVIIGGALIGWLLGQGAGSENGAVTMLSFIGLGELGAIALGRFVYVQK